MKLIYSLLFLFFIYACNQSNTTNVGTEVATEYKTNSKEQSLPVDHPDLDGLTEENDFDTSDTVSTFGPHSITRSVLQDRNGNMWFATWQGIIRYDGKLFTNFTLKEGLGHFHVFPMIEDHTGKLWFGSVGGGVYCYDGNSFTHYTSKDGLASNYIMSVYEDLAGNIWVGTKDNGVSCYNGKTFINYSTMDGLADNAVYAMVQDNTGKLWFGTEGGINSFYETSSVGNGSSGIKFKGEKDLPFQHVLALKKDKAGNIWIGSQAGLHKVDPASIQNTGTKAVTPVSEKFTPNIFIDKKGILWLSVGEINNPEMMLYCHDPTVPGKAFTKIKSEKQIFGVTEDINGNIWFGTETGVRRYDPATKTFTNFLKKINK